MEWQDEAVVLSSRPHGEGAAIVELFTASHGRHAGVVRGGASRRMAPHLQPGTQIAARWKARLEGHIGALTVEPLRARAGILGDRLALSALNSVCALLHVSLPEREPHAGLWAVTIPLLDQLGVGDWPTDYLRWEMRLLEDIGFGLDLSRCAVTGSREDLAYVSPRTGRAVGRDAAGEWADKLLPLPPCLLGQGAATAPELVQGLSVTGHFLTRELQAALNGRPLPDARARLIDLFARDQA